MYTAQPKKLLIINILDILKKYSDEDHRLSQKDIAGILDREYGMKADRKAIKRNLLDLADFGYGIEFSETARLCTDRKTGEKEENVKLTDFYLSRDFTDAELRLIIDGLLFSKHLPTGQLKELIGKLEGLSSTYFRSRTRYVMSIPDNSPKNKQIFLNIETLDEAMSTNKKIICHYYEYGVDKKLHPRLHKNGELREYLINPYQIAATNGKYYLICNVDRFDNVAHYRLDRISDIKLTDEPIKPMKDVKGLENGLDLPRHMAEHIYMFTGDNAPVVFRAKRRILSDLFDWFGNDMEFFDETEEDVGVRVIVNLQAMRCWALQYAVNVKVIYPAELVEEIRADIKSAAENYE